MFGRKWSAGIRPQMLGIQDSGDPIPSADSMPNAFLLLMGKGGRE